MKCKEHYDLSWYDKTHFLYYKTNCKIIGKFEDEMNRYIIEEFVGLIAGSKEKKLIMV